MNEWNLTSVLMALEKRRQIATPTVATGSTGTERELALY